MSAASVTTDISTPIGAVRHYCRDLSPTEPLFADAAIERMLDDCGAVVLLAAALALDVMAADAALVQKRIRLLDLETDGPAEAAALRATASGYRAQFAAQARRGGPGATSAHRPTVFTVAPGGRGG